MIPSTATLPPDALGLGTLATLLAPVMILAGSAVVLTLVMLVVGLIGEAREVARRRWSSVSPEVEDRPAPVRPRHAA